MNTFNYSAQTGKFLLLFLALIILSSCAERETIDACLHGHTYGFWGGLWHGIIAPIDFIAMLINNDKYTVYATNNNGEWYALGFLLGSGGWGLLGGKGLGRKRKREE